MTQTQLGTGANVFNPSTWEVVRGKQTSKSFFFLQLAHSQLLPHPSPAPGGRPRLMPSSFTLGCLCPASEARLPSSPFSCYTYTLCLQARQPGSRRTWWESQTPTAVAENQPEQSLMANVPWPLTELCSL